MWTDIDMYMCLEAPVSILKYAWLRFNRNGSRNSHRIVCSIIHFSCSLPITLSILLLVLFACVALGTHFIPATINHFTLRDAFKIHPECIAVCRCRQHHHHRFIEVRWYPIGIGALILFRLHPHVQHTFTVRLRLTLYIHIYVCVQLVTLCERWRCGYFGFWLKVSGGLSSSSSSNQFVCESQNENEEN